MTMFPTSRKLLPIVVVTAFCAFSISLVAQVKTETTTSSGTATHDVTVERGEVVSVFGNDLIVKMEDGSLRNFENLPDSARVMVDGKELGVHELKPGMKLQRTLTVTTTPQTITTTKTVTGKVWQVSPPKTVILTLENGTNESFTVPEGQKFTINGEQTDVWGLKKGMKVNATKIVEEPLTLVEHQRQVTGSMPPPPAPPVASMPILIAVAVPKPMLAEAAPPAPQELPKGASILPLIGFSGILAVLGALALRTRRSIL
jgi:hypothetical protein